ncbi:MAG TPA: nicotinamide riboside transporter PnuC [Flavisolibacter sp.]|jgi:nicotinamide mononucleotide transporter
MHEAYQQFLKNLQESGILEYIGVVAGILSVWFSKKENILVYPVGLVNTIIYVYLSFRHQLIGEATVNFYYTVVSIYGWWLWTRKDRRLQPVLQVTFSTNKEWTFQLLFFAGLYLAGFLALTYLQGSFYPGAIPWADAFASATAFTGMWLMARKKVESWYWWIATNIASIPLYYVKGLVLTSIYYFILLGLAIFGLMEWRARARKSAIVKE